LLACFLLRGVLLRGDESPPLRAIVKAVDTADEAALGDALDGCESASYLVHALGVGNFFRDASRHAGIDHQRAR
jgi:hypothetical protein